MYSLPTTALVSLLLLFCSSAVLQVTPASSLPADGNLPGCNETFSCGNTTDINFPFSGGPRPHYCGLPGFNLTCHDDSLTILTIDTLNYTVLHIDDSNPTLTLSRSDLYDSSSSSAGCITHFRRNSTFSGSNFTLSPNSQVLTLFYSCNYTASAYDYNPPNLFFCNGVNGTLSAAFYMVGQVPDVTESLQSRCGTSVTAPISAAYSGIMSNGSLLGPALRAGFDVSYSNPMDGDCFICYFEKHGNCGFDADSGKSICICGDRMCPDEKKKKKVVWMIMGGVLAAGGLLVTLVLMIWVKRKKQKLSNGSTHMSSDKEDIELPFFDLATIVSATNNFSPDNILGKGGFGTVYKGILQDGVEIAVKQLSSYSQQGINEFKNEAINIAKLQHRNLVSLLGCCVQHGERILLYEFMANKSLDAFIFDKTQCRLLDWPKRYNIIKGIARGILYLHQDSRLRIIHRDLKPSNVLLDNDMNPKISDFGLAKTSVGNAIQGNTKNIAGTYGYMSPEYAIDGIYSIKSDVFSFGVMILEIVSGEKNRGFNRSDHQLNLLGHAWTLQREIRAVEMIDETIRESGEQCQMLRLVHIGLLCVQKSPADRPNMSTVMHMLDGEGDLIEPKRPGFFTERDLSKGNSSFSESKGPFTNADMTASLLLAR